VGQRSRVKLLSGNLGKGTFKHREHRAHREGDREGAPLSHQHRYGKNFSPEIRAMPEFSSLINPIRKTNFIPTRTEIQGEAIIRKA